MHRREPERWRERATLETDDLDWLYWDRLCMRGPAVPTEAITCEWVDHARLRHKIMQESLGGINLFRIWYDIHEPLRFQSTIGNFTDEVTRYRAERGRPHTPPAPTR